MSKITPNMYRWMNEKVTNTTRQPESSFSFAAIPFVPFDTYICLQCFVGACKVSSDEWYFGRVLEVLCTL